MIAERRTRWLVLTFLLAASGGAALYVSQDVAEPVAAAQAAPSRAHVAPIVVAKGRGAVAEAILAKAREAGVHVHASSDLVAFLMQVDLDRRIPPALYVAVAEVLAWVHRLDTERAGATAPTESPT